MRRIVSATFITLDGVMQGPGGPDEDRSGGFDHGGWTVPFADDTISEAIAASMAEPSDLLLGRRTYEIFAAYWPSIDDHPIADSFNAATKYVVTNSGVELTWANSVALQGDVVAKLTALKQQDGPDLFVWGSSVLFPTLVAHDLLDEMTLFAYPITLGTGKRLFGEGTAPRSFTMVSNQTSSTGVTINTYRPAGVIETGTVTLD